MKKIMIVCNYLVGLMSFRKELLERLLREKNEIVVLAPDDKLSKDLKKICCNFIPV